MKPIDRKTVLEYIHESEVDDKGEPVEGATVWLYRGLSRRARAHVDDRKMFMNAGGDEDAQGMVLRAGSTPLNYVRYGLVGVRNFPAWKTEPCPFDLQEEELPTYGFLDTVPDEVFEGLHKKIREASTLSVKDAEKSSPSST